MSQPTRKITYLQAITEALDYALKRDSQVFLMGEDIGIYGGGFGATKGLEEKYGVERIRSTPISESAIVGAAVGAAMTGMRPVVELQFSDFITIAMDQIVNQAAKIHYMHNGQFKAPLVIRTPSGSGTGAGAQHSQSLENWVTHIPGLKVVQPSSAYDAKGLLLASIKDNNPVIFFEHKLCYKLEESVPLDYYEVPLGKACRVHEGSDVTIIATGYMVYKAKKIAVQLEKEGYSIEIIDPRTLVPLDIQTIMQSVFKTKRVLVVTEEVKYSGFGAELIAQIIEQSQLDHWMPKMMRLGGEFVPMPAAASLEKLAVPNEKNIAQAVKILCSDATSRS